MLIHTKRLTLRRITEADWRSIQAIWQDFKASPFSRYDVPSDTGDEAVRTRIAKWAKTSQSTEHMFFAVCLGERVIGYIAFNIRERGYEIGYCFHSDTHGMGYAKESLLALFDHLQALGVTTFIARTALANTPSVALLRSLGFAQTGTEQVSFYQDTDGNSIFFDGGIFELNL